LLPGLSGQLRVKTSIANGVELKVFPPPIERLPLVNLESIDLFLAPPYFKTLVLCVFLLVFGCVGLPNCYFSGQSFLSSSGGFCAFFSPSG